MNMNINIKINEIPHQLQAPRQKGTCHAATTTNIADFEPQRGPAPISNMDVELSSQVARSERPVNGMPLHATTTEAGMR